MAQKRWLVSLFAVAVLLQLLVVNTNFGLAQIGTEVSGVISYEANWTVANSPYTLLGQVYVNAGVILTIDPGVAVNLNGFCLQVDGILVAGGSGSRAHFEDGSILFTPESSGWDRKNGSGCFIENADFASVSISIENSPRIEFTSGSAMTIRDGAPLILNNTINAVYIGGGSPVISNNTIGLVPDSDGFDHPSSLPYGIWMGGNNAAYLSDNVIYADANRAGILIDAGNPTIQRNVVSNRYGYGSDPHYRQAAIEVEAGANPTIQNNTITGSAVGIALRTRSARIIFNNFEDNSNYNLYAYFGSVTGGVDAANNWWGTTDPRLIDQAIYNPGLYGWANYEPFLKEPNPEASPNPGFVSLPTPSLAPSPTPPAPTPPPSPTPLSTMPPVESSAPSVSPNQQSVPPAGFLGIIGPAEFTYGLVACELLCVAGISVHALKRRRINMKHRVAEAATSSYFNHEKQNLAKKYFYYGLGVSLIKYAILVCLALLVIMFQLSSAFDKFIMANFANPLLNVTLLILIGYDLFWLVCLPFDYVKEIRLGRRFGLFKNSTGKWLLDKLKMPALSFAAFSLIEGGLSLNVLNLTWVLVASSICVALVVFVFSSAAFSDSHFYRCVKLKDEELLGRFAKLFRSAGLKPIRVFELKTGTITTKGIAASSGIGFTRRIMLSDTLLSNYSKDEIESVVGHEIGHHKHGHLWKYSGAFTFFMITAFSIAMLIVQSIHGLLGFEDLYSAASFPLWALVFGLIFAGFIPLLNMLSRNAEGESDQYELELVKKPNAYISSMIKLCDQNLRYASPNRLIETVFYNHPSTRERVDRALMFRKSLTSNKQGEPIQLRTG